MSSQRVEDRDMVTGRTVESLEVTKIMDIWKLFGGDARSERAVRMSERSWMGSNEIEGKMTQIRGGGDEVRERCHWRKEVRHRDGWSRRKGLEAAAAASVVESAGLLLSGRSGREGGGGGS